MTKIVIALGGNALAQEGQKGTIPEQYENARTACRVIARELVAKGHSVLLTHGNGPQVGNILRRVELAAKELHELPLDTCGADSQGGIGYMFQQVLQDCLEEVGIKKVPLCLLTRTLVDEKDSAFSNPTKPIGSFMDEATAKNRAAKDGWSVKEDSGRGWRRVVASPIPKDVLEGETIRRLFDAGEVLIAGGGGGVPVARRDGHLVGVEAVIDKDRASAFIARRIGADLLLILTGVDRVVVNFKKPDARTLDRVGSDEIEKYLKEGHFPAGSMGPKVEAAIDFVRGGGKECLITSLEAVGAALEGKNGTRVTK